MEEAISWLIIAILLIVLLILGIRFVPAGAYCVPALLGFATFAALDQLFSAHLIHGAPWLMWTIWGAVLGMSIAFWTIAPVYGIRKRRSAILATPAVLIGLVAIIRLIV